MAWDDFFYPLSIYPDSSLFPKASFFSNTQLRYCLLQEVFPEILFHWLPLWIPQYLFEFVCSTKLKTLWKQEQCSFHLVSAKLVTMVGTQLMERWITLIFICSHVTKLMMPARAKVEFVYWLVQELPTGQWAQARCPTKSIQHSGGKTEHQKDRCNLSWLLESLCVWSHS